MPSDANTGGPLAGLQVVEIGSLGPGPHAAMMLSDMGADVVRIERPSQRLPVADVMLRGRTRVVADLKDQTDLARVRGLLRSSDVLLEGFRPGVMERLGLGPDECLAVNPRLIYARLTGWGQHGPWAQRAGHDLNYLSLTGVLNAIGRPGDRPVPPLNLVGDFGGGSMLAVTGILAALWRRDRDGSGQTIDVAMIDGIALLSQEMWKLQAQGAWDDDREAANLLNGAAPFYDTYTCADGRHVAVAAFSATFYANLVTTLGLDLSDLPEQHDRAAWPRVHALFADVFATRSRDDWAAEFDDVDACVTPVLTFAEGAAHPHVRARGTLIDVGGTVQSAPAPRFARTPCPPTSFDSVAAGGTPAKLN
ncbi:CaiB/BaiF CoA transferase family protein [Rhodococcus erythropolis]